MSPGWRYLAGAAALYAAALLAVVGVVRVQDDRLLSAIAADHLQVIDAAQRMVQARQAKELALRAEMIAGNQAVVSYVVQALDSALPGMQTDYASVEDLLEERRQQLGLAAVGVIDVQGVLIVASGPRVNRRAFDGLPAFDRARSQQTVQSAVIADGGRLLSIAIQPLAAYGTSEAYLLVAAPIDGAFARAIADVGATEVVVLDVTGDGPVAAASTLAPAPTARLLRALPADLARPRRLDLVLDGVRHRASLQPLAGETSARLLALVPPTVAGASRWTVGLPVRIGSAIALALLLGALVMYWLRVVAPLHALVGLVEYAARSGDVHLKAPVAGTRQVRALADAFNRLCQRLRPAPRMPAEALRPDPAATDADRSGAHS